MTWTRGHARLLLGIAAWMLLTWTMFIKNLAEAYAAGEDRPDGYWIAHSALIVVNLVIAAVLARLGWKIRSATR